MGRNTVGFAVEVLTALPGGRYHLGKRYLFDLSQLLVARFSIRATSIFTWPPKCSQFLSMAPALIVFVGSPQVETMALGQLAPEFGWSLAVAPGLGGLVNLSAANNLVAVLFDAEGLGLAWPHALRLVREAAPQALPVPCHRLSDRVNWPELAESGAFHALALPFNPSEVRQSLGFVSFAKSRRAANVLSISALERLGTAMDCRCGVTPCQCSDKAGADKKTESGAVRTVGLAG